VQEQLLMKDDEPATIYNRTQQAQRAALELNKKKFLFQASNAQQLYSQIYNSGKSVRETDASEALVTDS